MKQLFRLTKLVTTGLLTSFFGLALSSVSPGFALAGALPRPPATELAPASVASPTAEAGLRATRQAAATTPITLVGSISTATANPLASNAPSNVAVAGSYAYVLNTRAGTNGGAIVAVDISNPARPAVAAVTALPDGSYPRYLAASGGLVTVANMNQQYSQAGVQVATLATYSVAAPTAALPLLSSIGIPGNALAGLAMTGTTAYTLSDNFGGGSGTVAVVDLSTPASPVLRQNASTGRYTPTAFAVNGPLALTSSLGYNPVNVLSLTATTATKRGEALVGLDNSYPNANKAVAVGSTLGLALNFNNTAAPLLQVLSLATATPTLKGSLPLDAKAAVLTMVDDHFGYVLNQSPVNTLQVIDLSNPNAPVSVGSLTTSATPLALTVVGSYAYVTCSDNTLRVFALNLAPTLAAISPSAELPGNTITLAGTYFAANSAVSFGGVAAASVVFNSSTSLTVTVPAGVAAGPSSVVVGTSSGVSASPPAFAVLDVYAPPTANTCTTAVPATASLNDGQWHYLQSSTGQVVLAYSYTGASLGDLTVDVLSADASAPVRLDKSGRPYLDRNFHLTASGGRFDGRTVALRFYGLTSEFARLQAVRPAATLAGLYATQYSGPGEDCELDNNDATGENRSLPAPASSPSGTNWFVASVTVANHFSEFYLANTSAPLPVQLASFTATAAGPATVQLAWTTASEVNSSYFAVERSLDGQVFSPIGQLAATGTSTLARTYSLTDAALPTGCGTLYYRLRQVDVSGAATYSPSRTVALSLASQLRVFPNPASTQLTVAGTAAHAAIDIYNATGQLMHRTAADATGMRQVALPAGLPAGVYLVRSGPQAQRFSVE
jgi:hypothetical protein